MNNFRKIGLTALAGSLVATSVFAGELTASGGASIGVSNTTGSADTGAGKDWSMGNQITFSGSGELDNGMTVSLSFELDAKEGNAKTNAPFDNHSITIAHDTWGTLKFQGHPGTSAQGSIGTTAAGDLWNNTLGISDNITNAASGDDSMLYTLPALVDGLTVMASLAPSNATAESHTSFAATYAGVEGLSISYGQGDSGARGSIAETTTMKASYAYGPITVAASRTDLDEAGATADREESSYNISYTVSENISLSYGEETQSEDGQAVDEEVKGISASYTSGGVTLSAKSLEANGAGNSATAKTEKWILGASFAF
jgi:outer membrane protein OmpU